MKKIFALLAAFVMVFAMMGAPAHSVPVPNLACDGVVSSGTYKNVTVNSGDSCTLGPDVVVTGNVHGKKGAVDVIVQTAVGTDGSGNIQVNGATGTVYVGPGPNANGKLCKVDPPVGNNVHVTNSHNVLICEVTADNNIMVTNNDGFVVVQDSVAGNNIKVSRNSEYVADKAAANRFDVPRPKAVRVVRNVADNHIQLFHNRDPLVHRKNSPEPVVK